MPKIGRVNEESELSEELCQLIALTLWGTVASPDPTYFFTNFRDLNVILIRLSNCFLLFYDPRTLPNINARLKVLDFVKIYQFW